MKLDHRNYLDLNEKICLQQGRCRLLESGTAIEHRWCLPTADGMRGGGGEDERGVDPLW